MHKQLSTHILLTPQSGVPGSAPSVPPTQVEAPPISDSLMDKTGLWVKNCQGEWCPAMW